MNRFVANQYDDASFHTIGVEFLNKDIEVEGIKYTLQVNLSLIQRNYALTGTVASDLGYSWPREISCFANPILSWFRHLFSLICGERQRELSSSDTVA
jgi:hypothetical protein